jgi:Na+/H+-translocating membrane pyrophosphatase
VFPIPFVVATVVALFVIGWNTSSVLKPEMFAIGAIPSLKAAYIAWSVALSAMTTCVPNKFLIQLEIHFTKIAS